MLEINLLRKKMIPFVGECLKKHGGGERYFDELDGMIKNDIDLLVSFLRYAVHKEGIHNVVVSGEIGQLLNNIECLKDIDLICVNGGLRKGKTALITGVQPRKEPFEAIFFDDSYYSGKTFKAVEECINEFGGNIVKSYVFYDGSPEERDDIVSLYRYYGYYD